jgi:propanediol dehydratase large subunit
MQGRKLISTIFILFFIGSTVANEQLKTQLENSDTLVASKQFQLLLLIPTDTKLELKDAHENHIEIEEKVHHSDLISTFLEEFKSNGGLASNVDALLKDTQSRQLVKPLLLDFNVKKDNIVRLLSC